MFSLYYHRVADTHLNSWSIRMDDFREQILWMKEAYDMISLEEAQRRIREGNRRPAIAITFDDGYSENNEEAIPFLLSEQVPFTYFVTTDHTINQKPFPHDVEEGTPLPTNTVESLRAMANAGVDIGAHTRTHLDLGKATDPDLIFDEIVVATREMERAIGHPLNYFAFPYGQYCNLNNNVFKLLKQAGFKGVCSAYGGWNSVGDDAFHIQRLHGDPNFPRIKNWLGFDPRLAGVERYDYSRTSIDWSGRDFFQAPKKQQTPLPDLTQSPEANTTPSRQATHE